MCAYIDTGSISLLVKVYLGIQTQIAAVWSLRDSVKYFRIPSTKQSLPTLF